MARILIAEDEEALCALRARALTSDGHEVKTAIDGSDALDVLVRGVGHDEADDLQISEVGLPE